MNGAGRMGFFEHGKKHNQKSFKMLIFPSNMGESIAYCFYTVSCIYMGLYGLVKFVPSGHLYLKIRRAGEE